MNRNGSNDFLACSIDSILQEISKNGIKSRVSSKPHQKHGENLNDSDCQLVQQDFQGIAELLPAIGLLRVNWRNRKEELISINYGTAFAVSPKIIITCTHNIYSEHQRTLTSEIFFIPGIDGSKNHGRAYRCTKKDQIRCRVPDQSLSFYPLREELAMFALDEGQELDCERYVKLGMLEDQEGAELKIIGYPSESFYKQVNLHEVQPIRTNRKGKIHSLDQHIINYSIPTYPGQSGSPVLALDSHHQHFAIGIHTHRGFRPSFNSGLSFNHEILAAIRIYEQELSQLFPAALKEDIYHESAKVTEKRSIPTPQQYFQENFDPGTDNRESLTFYQQLFDDQLCLHQLDMIFPQHQDHFSLVSVSEDSSDIQQLYNDLQSFLSDQFDRSDFISLLNLSFQPSIFSKMDLSLQASTHIPLEISQNSLDSSNGSVYEQLYQQFLDVSWSDPLQEEQRNVLAIARTKYDGQGVIIY